MSAKKGKKAAPGVVGRCVAAERAVNGFTAEKCAYRNGGAPLKIAGVIVKRPPTCPLCVGCTYWEGADE